MAPSESRDRSANRRISAFFLPRAKASPPPSNSDSDSDDRKGRRSSVNPPLSLSSGKSRGRSHLAPPVNTQDELQPPGPAGVDSRDSRSKSPASFPNLAPDLPNSRPRVPSISIPSDSNRERGPATATDHAGKLRKRRNSWLRGTGAKDQTKESNSQAPKAWIAGYDGKPAYNSDFLLNGQQVPELWDDLGGSSNIHGRRSG